MKLNKEQLLLKEKLINNIESEIINLKCELKNVDKVNNKIKFKRLIKKIKEYTKLLHPIVLLILLSLMVSDYMNESPFKYEEDRTYYSTERYIDSKGTQRIRSKYKNEDRDSILIHYSNYEYNSETKLYTRFIKTYQLYEINEENINRLLNGETNVDFISLDLMSTASESTNLYIETEPEKVEVYLYNKDLDKYIYRVETNDENIKDILSWSLNIIIAISAYLFICWGPIKKNIVDIRFIDSNLSLISKEELEERINIKKDNIKRLTYGK